MGSSNWKHHLLRSLAISYLSSPPLRNLWPGNKFAFMSFIYIYGVAVDAKASFWICSVRPYQTCRIDYISLVSLSAVFDCLLNVFSMVRTKLSIYTPSKSHTSRFRQTPWSFHPRAHNFGHIIIDLVIWREKKTSREREGTIYKGMK